MPDRPALLHDVVPAFRAVFPSLSRSLERRVFVPLAGVLLCACSVGSGNGQFSGWVEVPDCTPRIEYNMRPTLFVAEAVEDLLRVRVQRGSDLEVLSDGLSILVNDAAHVQRTYARDEESDRAARPMDLSLGEELGVSVTLYLNATCPVGREQERTPVVLGATSGQLLFNGIYAPRADPGDVEISAELIDLVFEDPRDEKRRAELDGDFSFLHARGSPAQPFP